MDEKKFNSRGFTSFVMAVSFMVLTVTGVVLYVAPPGRITYWINWTFLGVAKTGWQTAHTVFSFLFIVAALYHLLDYNWKIFKGYLMKREGKGLRLKKELLASLVLALVFLAGSVSEVPPFKTIMIMGEDFRGMWYTKQDEPPIPHAEVMTLKEISNRLGMDTKEAVAILKAKGIQVEREDQRLAGIARKNRVSARELFQALEKKK